MLTKMAATIVLVLLEISARRMGLVHVKIASVEVYAYGMC